MGAESVVYVFNEKILKDYNFHGEWILIKYLHVLRFFRFLFNPKIYMTDSVVPVSEITSIIIDSQHEERIRSFLEQGSYDIKVFGIEGILEC